MKEPEQGARSRNAVPSEARDVPLLLLFNDEGMDVAVKFNVSYLKLVNALNYIAEGHDAEQRQARSRKVFADLIATSHK